MIRKKLFKILSLSLTISVSSIGFAFAETSANLDEPVSRQITAFDEAMYEAQTEIDKLLFEQSYAKDLSEKGISVTHTATVDDYVEVGITPHTPENADVVEDAKIISAPAEKEVEKNGVSTLTILGLIGLAAFGGLMLFKTAAYFT